MLCLKIESNTPLLSDIPKKSLWFGFAWSPQFQCKHKTSKWTHFTVGSWNFLKKFHKSFELKRWSTENIEENALLILKKMLRSYVSALNIHEQWVFFRGFLCKHVFKCFKRDKSSSVQLEPLHQIHEPE